MSDCWIDLYAHWSQKRSPLTPLHFHKNIALSLAAGAIAGRVYIQLPHAKIYPNLYTLIVAKTSVFAKTTAFDIAREATRDTMAEKVMDEIATPEAFLSLLAGSKPTNFKHMSDEQKKYWEERTAWGARRLFMLDEAGRLFNVLRRDYNSDLADVIMKLYDAGGAAIERTTRKMGYESVGEYALSCLFATTPAGIRWVLSTSDAWNSGFWIRWNFVAERTLTPWKDGEFIDPPKSVLEPLRRLSKTSLSKYNNKAFSMSAEDKVFKVFNEASRLVREQIDQSEDERMDGMLSRLPIKHFKAAMILSLLEADGQTPRLQLKHWEAALPFAEGWRRDALIVLELATHSERMTLEDRVLQYIFGTPQGAEARNMYRALNISAEQLQSVLDVFKKNGVVTPIQGPGHILLWKRTAGSEVKYKTVTKKE